MKTASKMKMASKMKLTLKMKTPSKKRPYLAQAYTTLAVLVLSSLNKTNSKLFRPILSSILATILYAKQEAEVNSLQAKDIYYPIKQRFGKDSVNQQIYLLQILEGK